MGKRLMSDLRYCVICDEYYEPMTRIGIYAQVWDNGKAWAFYRCDNCGDRYAEPYEP
jgi:hypothetical protein